MKTDTETLIKTMRILAQDIDSEDGVANSAIGEAANRLEELQLELTETIEELNHWQVEVTKERIKTEKAYKLRKDAEIERDSLRDTMALDMVELTKQRDELQQVNKSMQIDRDLWIKVGREKLEAAERERDEARAEVERVCKELESARIEASSLATCIYKMYSGIRKQRDEARAQTDKVILDYEKLRQECKESRAEVERLNKELEQAISERTPHDYGILAEQRDEYRRMFYDAVKTIDKERAEVQRLKVELEKETIEKAIINQQLTVRPEPSRLEIAAMFAVAAMIAKGRLTDHADSALLEADALIAAAKE